MGVILDKLLLDRPPSQDLPSGKDTGAKMKLLANLIRLTGSAAGGSGASLPTGLSLMGVHGPPRTASLYEGTTSPSILYSQGETQAGNGRSGLVILDFGRPAQVNTTAGFVDYSGHFDSVSAVLAGVKAYATFSIAIGTNNSCTLRSTSCCPCSDNVSNLTSWGSAFAGTVNSSHSSIQQGYSGKEAAAAADDAEPGYDPVSAECQIRPNAVPPPNRESGTSRSSGTEE